MSKLSWKRIQWASIIFEQKYRFWTGFFNLIPMGMGTFKKSTFLYNKNDMNQLVDNFNTEFVVVHVNIMYLGRTIT